MKLTFASLSRMFRALASLERTGAIKTVTFGEEPRITLQEDTFKELFPDIPAVKTEYGTFYHVPFNGLEVFAWAES